VYWRTYGKDGKYYLKLEVANASKTVIGQDVIALQLDNTAPAMYSFSGTNPLFPQTGVAIKDLGLKDDAQAQYDLVGREIPREVAGIRAQAE
jgi:hypothetical protein